MSMNFALSWNLCLIAITAVYGSSFPSDIPRCQTGDTSCVTRVATDLVRQYGRSGYPAAGIPSIEPFHLASADLTDGRQGSVSLKLHFRDISVEGISAAQLDRSVGFERDPSTSKFEMYGSFPKITLKGKYSADGQILILPIKGDGDANIVLEKPKFSVKFKPALNKKDGKTYMSVDKLKVLVEPQKMTIKLTNLFNGDKALGDNLNLFLNENWKDVWNELEVSIHKTIGDIVKTILASFFKKFAYEDLFTDF